MATSKNTAGNGKFTAGNPGKPKGALNKTTREFKETVAKLLETNADNVSIWLAQVAMGVGDSKPDPGKALDLMAKLAEFAAPKLTRVDHTGGVDNKLTVEIVRYGQDNAS